MSVRIPQSGGRNSKGFAKLIERVDPRRADAFGFSGRFLKPGALLDDVDIRPPGWPDPPLLLEFVPAEGARSGWLRHQAADAWILWTWRAKTGEWEELGRAAGIGSDWVQVLRPLALAHLTPPPLVWRRTLSEARERIEIAIDAELEAVEGNGHRAALLSTVHDIIASRASFLPDFESEGGSVGPEESRPTNTATVIPFSLLSLPYMQAGMPQSTGGNSPTPLGESNRDCPNFLGESDANAHAFKEKDLAYTQADRVDWHPVSAKPIAEQTEREVIRRITSNAAKARHAKLTPEQRSEAARKLALTRWERRGEAKQAGTA